MKIRTQIETGAGMPDLEIELPSDSSWIEVKVESGLSTGN